MIIYNLFPLLAGPFAWWAEHFQRAANTIAVADLVAQAQTFLVALRGLRRFALPHGQVSEAVEQPVR